MEKMILISYQKRVEMGYKGRKKMEKEFPYYLVYFKEIRINDLFINLNTQLLVKNGLEQEEN